MGTLSQGAPILDHRTYVRVNPAHPLAKYCVFGAFFNQGHFYAPDIVSGNKPTLSDGTVTNSVHQRGRALGITGATADDGVLYGRTGLDEVTGNGTIVALGWYGGGTGRETIIGTGKVGNAPEANFRFLDGGGWESNGLSFMLNNGAVHARSGDVLPGTGLLIGVAVAWDGTNAYFTCDANDVYTSTGAAATPTASANRITTIGVDRQSYDLTGGVQMVLCFDVFLERRWVLDLLANPVAIASPRRAMTAKAPVAAAGALAGAATGTGVAAGALSASARLAGPATGTGVGAGAMSVAARLVGAAAGTGVAAGSLSTSTPLAGKGVGTGVAAGALTVSAPLAGAATGTGVAAGTLAVEEPASAALVGSAVGTGVGAAALSVSAPLAGVATGTGVAAGTLETTDLGQIAGAAVGTGSCNARLNLNLPSDADTLATTYTDVQGTTIRAPMPTLLHAMDSARNADLIGAHRLPRDRYSARSSRAGRLPNSGRQVRILMFTSRAGDALAPRDFILDVSVSGSGARVKAADTTSRTDVDGTTLRVATTRAYLAPDSGRNADLKLGSTDRDRFWTQHQFDKGEATRGMVHRVMLVSDGRAGNVWAPRDLILDVAGSGLGDVKAKAT